MSLANVKAGDVVAVCDRGGPFVLATVEQAGPKQIRVNGDRFARETGRNAARYRGTYIRTTEPHDEERVELRRKIDDVESRTHAPNRQIANLEDRVRSAERAAASAQADLDAARAKLAAFRADVDSAPQRIADMSTRLAELGKGGAA